MTRADPLFGSRNGQFYQPLSRLSHPSMSRSLPCLLMSAFAFYRFCHCFWSDATASLFQSFLSCDSCTQLHRQSCCCPLIPRFSFTLCFLHLLPCYLAHHTNRVPDGHVAVVANGFIIRQIDLDQPDFFLASQNIFEVWFRSIVIACAESCSRECARFSRVCDHGLCSFGVQSSCFGEY